MSEERDAETRAVIRGYAQSSIHWRAISVECQNAFVWRIWVEHHGQIPPREQVLTALYWFWTGWQTLAVHQAERRI